MWLCFDMKSLRVSHTNEKARVGLSFARIEDCRGYPSYLSIQEQWERTGVVKAIAALTLTFLVPQLWEMPAVSPSSCGILSQQIEKANAPWKFSPWWLDSQASFHSRYHFLLPLTVQRALFPHILTNTCFPCWEVSSMSQLSPGSEDFHLLQLLSSVLFWVSFLFAFSCG